MAANEESIRSQVDQGKIESLKKTFDLAEDDDRDYLILCALTCLVSRWNLMKFDVKQRWEMLKWLVDSISDDERHETLDTVIGKSLGATEVFIYLYDLPDTEYNHLVLFAYALMLSEMELVTKIEKNLPAKIDSLKIFEMLDAMEEFSFECGIELEFWEGDGCDYFKGFMDTYTRNDAIQERLSELLNGYSSS
jgi:hypothetical protein